MTEKHNSYTPDTKNVMKSIGVSLSQSEIHNLEKITADLDLTGVKISRSKVMRFAIQYFLAQHNLGAISLTSSINERVETIRELGEYK